MKASAAKFKPLYDAADIDIDAEPFRKFAERKVFKDAFKAVRCRLHLARSCLKIWRQLSPATLSQRRICRSMQGLDRVINANTDTVTGKLNDTARDVLTVRNQFKAEIGDLNEAFKKADAQFADYELTCAARLTWVTASKS